jgi:hypothetical protein
MPDGNSLINLGNLSEPATKLIEKIADAIGVIYAPYQVKRMARAEVKAEEIKALAKIKIGKLEIRALRRFVQEEARKQSNIENITSKSLPDLGKNAKPDEIEDDWIVNFFDKAKLISDDDMQNLWAKILAGEANMPGSYSKRTLFLLSTLDKDDAVLFSKLCNFIWEIGNPEPLIFDSDDEIYKKQGVNFSTLKHLDSIGLISFESLAGYQRAGFGKKITVQYQGMSVTIEFSKDENNELNMGHVLLSDAGEELTRICKLNIVDGFIEYVIEKWKKDGLILIPPLAVKPKI